MIVVGVLYLMFTQLLNVMGKPNPYPDTDMYGHQIANEFQWLHTENMAILGEADAVVGVNTSYIITDVFPTVINNNDVVTVQYKASNYSTTNNRDWIGAYSPPIDYWQINTTVPVKYGWCDDDPNYLVNGTGTNYAFP